MKFILRAVGAAIALLAAASVVQAADPVVIGLEIPLSPPGDPASGQLIRRGGELAIEYINGPMGGVLPDRKAALAVQDSQGRTESGIAAYRRLVTEDRAVGVTGFFHSSVNLAVNEVAKEINGRALVRIRSHTSQRCTGTLALALKPSLTQPPRISRTVTVIRGSTSSDAPTTTDSWLFLDRTNMKQSKQQKLGLELMIVTFDHGSTDLTPLLLQVKAFKPELVINIGVGQPMDLMIEQAATLGITPQTPMLVSYDAPIRPQFWQLHPKTGAGLYYIAYYSPKQKLSDAGDWFVKAYEAKYSESPVYSSLNGFGDVLIFAQAVKQANSTDPKAVIKALETGTFKSWTSSPVTFPRAEGVFFHNWSPPILILHYTSANQDWKSAEIMVEHAGTTP